MIKRLRSWLSMLQLLWYTFLVSARITFEPYFKRFVPRHHTTGVLNRWAKKCIKTCDASVQITGLPKLDPGRSYIFMSNHWSIFDIPVIYSSLPGEIRMVAKRELFRIPLFGHAMRQAEFIEVDRDNHEKAIVSLNSAAAKLKDGIVVWIAPEGRRPTAERLLPFKKGGFVLAIKTQAIILPVTIRGANEVLPHGQVLPELGKTIEVQVGTPIDSAHYALDQKDVLMRMVEQQMRMMLGQAEQQPELQPQFIYDGLPFEPELAEVE